MWEDVMPGRDRSMRGEDGTLTDQFAGFRMRRTLLNELTYPLQGQEGRVPFIGMPHGRGDPERTQHAHTADSQKNFLADPHLLIPAIESSGEGAVFWAVFRHVRIDEKQRDSAHQQFPHGSGDAPVPHVDGKPARFTGRSLG